MIALGGKEAERMGHSYIGTEHILLGLLKLGQGAAFEILSEKGINLLEMRAAVLTKLTPDSEHGAISKALRELADRLDGQTPPPASTLPPS